MPAVVDQWCDSTSAKQSAVNPHSLGASRALGIRMHGTRYAISRKHLNLRYVITEDQVSDFTTKRMPRKHLARLAVIFYNNLQPNWQENPDVLKPLRDVKWYPELKKTTCISVDMSVPINLPCWGVVEMPVPICKRDGAAHSLDESSFPVTSGRVLSG